MTYPFVQAHNDYGLRKGPVRAFVIHMAEGGGTVGYLDTNGTAPPRGVSVHYVIERTGRIVQMLLETHTSGSINPQDIRTTDDADGFYGVTDAKAVMGAWWGDPNSAVISVEVEGYAATGPSPVQATALVRLVNDVRSRYPGIGLLGHRDFADYKACPGKHIDWHALGGHGVYVKPAPPVVTRYTLHIAANAVVRVAQLTTTGQISGWTTSKWGPTASSAPCAKPVKRAGVSRGSATTALVKAGKFAGKHVGVAGGVTVTAEAT